MWSVQSAANLHTRKSIEEWCFESKTVGREQWWYRAVGRDVEWKEIGLELAWRVHQISWANVL